MISIKGLSCACLEVEQKLVKMEDNSCFYKVIIFKDTQELRIPQAFVESHRRSLLDHAFLQACFGEEHRVELTKHDDDLWFSNGWTDFAKQYSINPGHFLVFRYLGHSSFHVLIFDSTCSEIKYPRSCKEIEDVREGKSDALKKAEELVLTLSNPNFITSMRSSQLTGNDVRMWVPDTCARKYVKGVNVVYLKVEGEPSGKTWKVFAEKTSGRVRFSEGWRGFVVENRLEAGDVCVFELVNPRDKTYLVRIFKSSMM